MSTSHRPEQTEAEFLRDYQPRAYPKPSVTVDLVIFTITDTDLKVLLIQRKDHPHRGSWALPGGFVDVGDGVRDQGESVEQAAHRELAEETSLPPGTCFLEQLYTFGDPGRDPRLRVISVAYYALIGPDKAPLVRAGDDAADARWLSVQHEVLGKLPLAFDHAKVLSVAVERIRGKIDYTPIAFELVPPTFTAPELREVYAAVKGDTYSSRTFNRKFQRMVADGVLHEAPGKRMTGGRPAKVYRFEREG